MVYEGEVAPPSGWMEVREGAPYVAPPASRSGRSREIQPQQRPMRKSASPRPKRTSSRSPHPPIKDSRRGSFEQRQSNPHEPQLSVYSPMPALDSIYLDIEQNIDPPQRRSLSPGRRSAPGVYKSDVYIQQQLRKQQEKLVAARGPSQIQQQQQSVSDLPPMFSDAFLENNSVFSGWSEQQLLKKKKKDEARREERKKKSYGKSKKKKKKETRILNMPTGLLRSKSSDNLQQSSPDRNKYVRGEEDQLTPPRATTTKSRNRLSRYNMNASSSTRAIQKRTVPLAPASNGTRSSSWRILSAFSKSGDEGSTQSSHGTTDPASPASSPSSTSRKAAAARRRLETGEFPHLSSSEPQPSLTSAAAVPASSPVKYQPPRAPPDIHQSRQEALQQRASSQGVPSREKTGEQQVSQQPVVPLEQYKEAKVVSAGTAPAVPDGFDVNDNGSPASVMASEAYNTDSPPAPNLSKESSRTLSDKIRPKSILRNSLQRTVEGECPSDESFRSVRDGRVNFTSHEMGGRVSDPPGSSYGFRAHASQVDTHGPSNRFSSVVEGKEQEEGEVSSVISSLYERRGLESGSVYSNTSSVRTQGSNGSFSRNVDQQRRVNGAYSPSPGGFPTVMEDSPLSPPRSSVAEPDALSPRLSPLRGDKFLDQQGFEVSPVRAQMIPDSTPSVQSGAPSDETSLFNQGSVNEALGGQEWGEELNDEDYFMHVVAAVVIQTAARRLLANLEVEKRIEELIEQMPLTRDDVNSQIMSTASHDSAELSRGAPANPQFEYMAARMWVLAAIKIQAAFRGWWVRDSLFVDHYCATSMQRIIRGHICRVSYHYDLYRIVLIQAVFRGYLQRKRFQQHGGDAFFNNHLAYLQNQQVSRDDEGIELFEAEGAAILIQARFRGFLEETHYLHVLADVILIQSVARRWLTAAHVETLRRLEEDAGAEKQQHSVVVSPPRYSGVPVKKFVPPGSSYKPDLQSFPKKAAPPKFEPFKKAAPPVSEPVRRSAAPEFEPVKQSALQPPPTESEPVVKQSGPPKFEPVKKSAPPTSKPVKRSALQVPTTPGSYEKQTNDNEGHKPPVKKKEGFGNAASFWLQREQQNTAVPKPCYRTNGVWDNGK